MPPRDLRAFLVVLVLASALLAGCAFPKRGCREPEEHPDVEPCFSIFLGVQAHVAFAGAFDVERAAAALDELGWRVAAMTHEAGGAGARIETAQKEDATLVLQGSGADTWSLEGTFDPGPDAGHGGLTATQVQKEGESLRRRVEPEFELFLADFSALYGADPTSRAWRTLSGVE